jgi:hypothetical protein
MAKSPASGRSYKHASHVSWRRVDNESVVLDLNSSVYFSLNEVGTLIWDRLGAGKSLEDIREEICASFDVKPQEAQKDMDALVAKLCKENLLVAG